MNSSKKTLKAAIVFVLTLVLLTNAIMPMAVVGSKNDNSSEYQFYSVKAGDTLTRIAQKHGVTVSDIMTANKLSNADKIYSGQILKVPVSSAMAQDNPLYSSRFSMHLVNVNVKDALSMIALNAGYTIVMADSSNEQTVTVTLEQMSALKALDYVTRLADMTFLKDGSTIYVGSAEALNSTFVDKTVLTRVSLNYITVEHLQTQMGAVGLSNVQIVTTNNKDEFYVSGYPKELAKVTELIRLLDVPSNIMAGGGVIASEFTPLELEHISADEFNGLLGNLGLSTGLVLSSRPYTLYVYVSGANLTDIKTIKNIVDKPLSGKNLEASQNGSAGQGEDTVLPPTPGTNPNPNPGTNPNPTPGTDPTPGTNPNPQPQQPAEETILREIVLNNIDRNAVKEILQSFPLKVTLYGPENMLSKVWVAGTKAEVDQAEAYIRQFDTEDYADAALNNKRFFPYQLQHCTAAEMLDRLALLNLEGVTFKTDRNPALTKSLLVYCDPVMEEPVRKLLLEMDTTSTDEKMNYAIEATASEAVANQRISTLRSLYPEINGFQFTIKLVPDKSGEGGKYVTYVMATSKEADYIRALYEEMNSAA